MLKVLLPTDFSENAWNAISYAMEYFKGKPCEFFLLHTYTPVFYRVDYLFGGPVRSALPDTGVERAHAGLEDTLDRLRENYKDEHHSFTVLSAFNQLTSEIRSVVRKKKIDMIVMGTKGATGAKNIFMGSNAVHVLHKSEIPVLVVPKGCTFQPIQNVLYPTGFWSRYEQNELAPLMETVRSRSASLTVLHVHEEFEDTQIQEKNKNHLKNFLEGVRHEILDDKVNYMPTAIFEHTKGDKYQLVVMTNPRHTFLERLLVAQNVDEVSLNINTPFLVIPE